MRLQLDMQNKYRTLKPLPKMDALLEIDQRIQDLHTVIEAHRECVFSILGRGEKGREAESRSHSGGPWSREQQLKKALEEAIEVLEESRKAFKSKQLERLRKKLTRVLIEAY